MPFASSLRFASKILYLKMFAPLTMMFNEKAARSQKEKREEGKVLTKELTVFADM